MKTIVLFTSSFPYGKGEQFLETEINYLVEKFDKIVIVPAKIDGNKRHIPNNIDILYDISNTKKNLFARLKSAFFSAFFYKNLTLNFNEIRYLFIQMVYLKEYQSVIKKLIDINKIDKIIFYSYWFDASTIALALIHKIYPSIKFICRVHRGDLYENIIGINNFPYRRKVFSSISMVYPISQHGKYHLLSKYKYHEEKIKVFRLGVEGREILSRPSNDDILRIVSCSSIIPIKRIDFIIDVLYDLSKHSNIMIQWIHIGDGYLKDKMIEKCRYLFPNNSNIKYNLLGYIPNQSIFIFFQNNPVDVFINLSDSEGIPVSIMEVLSLGIPVIGRNVGGMCEIVNNNNGFLLKELPTIKEVKDVICDVFYHRKEWLARRKEAYLFWSKHYNACINYPDFTEELLML